MEKIIKVTGKGKLLVSPDTVRLLVTLEGMQPEYDKAMEQSACMTEEIRNLFVQLGFAKSDVRTLQFNINADYENFQDKDKSWKRRLVGYKFYHRVKVEFPVDNVRLGKILYAVGHSAMQPEIQIEYTVSNPEECKNELLANAVADSVKKANVLANAAGVALGDIVQIDYSFEEVEFVARPMEAKMMNAMGRSVNAPETYNIDIEPDDISVTDHVTVVWEIINGD